MSPCQRWFNVNINGKTKLSLERYFFLINFLITYNASEFLITIYYLRKTTLFNGVWSLTSVPFPLLLSGHQHLK